ncbi:hypothetical protein KUCAC02_003148 [Chaenocephalus aceratus]|uniref:Uncharacterized protein n=1 Tax=Chaenocephalus aceratus TaxID=36190 RepID=A0ACB9WLA6_CHAAC|nr:hypothetical protein KUCAC02_003148 [Chaenocephalus aceratus]
MLLLPYGPYTRRRALPLGGGRVLSLGSQHEQRDQQPIT